MANIKAHAGAIDLDNGNPIEETFVDNGDGTFARLGESNYYGTPSAGTNVTVGTTSTAVLPANPNRKFLVLCNDSVNTIYVDLSGADAVLSKGVRLGSGGGSILLDRYVPVSAITAIATGAGSLLAIQEG